MTDRPMCDSRFCHSLATWFNERSDAYACDEHVPPDHAGWVQPLGWLSEVAFDPGLLHLQQPADDELYQRLANSMTNHTPSAEQVERIEAIRDAGKVLAWDIANSCPLSRERSIAATHLEDCIMWAVKSIVLEQ